MKKDLGRVMPILTGDYSATTSYEINDIVMYGGSLYWHTGIEKTTDIPPTDSSVWKKIFDSSNALTAIQTYAEQASESATLAQASAIAAAQSAREAEEAAHG